jgi:hypothetical protein
MTAPGAVLELPEVAAVLITRETVYPSDAWPQGVRFGETIVETGCSGVPRRWALAQAARSPVIYVQDDDVAADVPALWAAFDGAALTYAITKRGHAWYRAVCNAQACLIGYGAFFPRAALDPTTWAAWVEAYGPIPAHEADRIATWFLDCPRRPVLTAVDHRPRARAMSRDNPDHYTSRNRTIARLLALGSAASTGRPTSGSPASVGSC